jgi:hypothetical protein
MDNVMDKNQLADMGLAIASRFCEINTNISSPTFRLYRDPYDVEVKKIKAVGTCGYYRRGVIHIAIPACAHNNPSYSWPGFISDRTPYGVIQHELGHHVDEIMSGLDVYRNKPGNFFSDKIREQSGEKPITSYSPNTMEWFAEIFRLFVTNPLLLERIRPKAYKAIAEHFKPVVNLPEIGVLSAFQAPEKVLERMFKWISGNK